MQQLNKKITSLRKPCGINILIMTLISIVLILSFVFHYLLLSKVTKVSEDLHSQGLQPAPGYNNVYEQRQALFPINNPEIYKIRDIYQQIINRQVVKEDYLIGISIDNQLMEDIREYNELIPRLKGFFSMQAVKTLIGVFELKGIKDEDGRIFAPEYLNIPPEVREYAEIIADLSLYKNCTELLCNDSRLAFIIYSEGGGSAGLWPYLWHTEYLREHEDIKEDLNRLFDLVERIIASLDKEYENIMKSNLPYAE